MDTPGEAVVSLSRMSVCMLAPLRLVLVRQLVDDGDVVVVRLAVRFVVYLAAPETVGLLFYFLQFPHCDESRAEQAEPDVAAVLLRIVAVVARFEVGIVDLVDDDDFLACCG